MTESEDLDHNPGIFRFMVTTDSHMGYKHDDPLRGQDSFKSFEESLKLAGDYNVDFILLGGDLFHVSRPSLDSINKCSSIIRKYTFTGGKSPTFVRVQGQFSHKKFKHGNFEDPAYNVARPILSIHGNHDEPVGSDGLCVCQALADNASLNYIGSFSRKNQDLNIDPLVLQKGDIKLAIYGLGFLPDALLKKKWSKNQVHFSPPPEDTFSIFVLHQNTSSHGSKDLSFIDNEMIPKFFDLVIRGHEHDALDPVQVPGRDQVVFQPGSTVATSLSSGEALPKRIGIVDVRRNDSDSTQKPYIMNIDLLPLHSCRKMLIRDLYWSEINTHVQRRIKALRHASPPDIPQYVKEYVCLELDNMLQAHEFENSDPCGDMDSPLVPLVRIRVEFIESSQCFSQPDFKNEYYPKRVANKDIVLFKKQKLVETLSGTKIITFDDGQETGEDDYDPFDGFDPEPLIIDRMLKSYFDDKSESERPQAINCNEFLSEISKDEFQLKYVETYAQARYKFWKTKFERSIRSEEYAGEDLNDEVSIREHIEKMIGFKKDKEMSTGGDFSD